MWSQTDFSFKKFLNKRITSAIKKPYEEFGDVAVDVHASEVKYSPIAFDNPAQSVTNGVAEQRNLFALTLDNSVASNQSWFAAVGPTRLNNWLSDKYGPSYTIKLYDNSNNQIFPTDTVDWIFDYVTGVLMFNGNANAFSQPFKISGYRYIGQYLSDITPGGGGGGHVLLYNNTPLPQRTKLNFLGSILNLSDDSLNDQTLASLIAVPAPNTSYTPTTPGNWSFSVTPVNVQQALDDIAGYLALTAPAKALLLTSQTLTFAGQTLFTGKIAGGLPSSWYLISPAGSTISNLVYSGVFTLKFLGFRSGSASTPSTYGIITANVNGVDVNSYSMTAGPGLNGIIQASNLQVFNSIWEKADGTINANQLTEGAGSYVMKHTEAGNSNIFSVHFDNSALAVTFSSPLALTINTPVLKWLSGVSYLGLGTTLNASFTAVNLFSKVYVPSGAVQISLLGAALTNFDPSSVPNYTDIFNGSGILTLNVANVSSVNPVATATARKPNNLIAATSNFNVISIANGISTYGIVATVTDELFQDESKRLYHTALTAFDSTAVLPTDELKVIPGSLTFGSGGASTKYFARRFTKAATNNGNIIFGNIFTLSQVSQFGSGNLNILLKLETDGLWFDLGRPFGSNNGTGDGSTPANSMGARTSFAAGNFGYSFGTFSTANNSSQYQLLIIEQAGAAIITSIITS